MSNRTVNGTNGVIVNVWLNICVLASVNESNTMIDPAVGAASLHEKVSVCNTPAPVLTSVSLVTNVYLNGDSIYFLSLVVALLPLESCVVAL
jgi:hypothetical protein